MSDWIVDDLFWKNKFAFKVNNFLFLTPGVFFSPNGVSFKGVWLMNKPLNPASHIVLTEPLKNGCLEILQGELFDLSFKVVDENGIPVTGEKGGKVGKICSLCSNQKWFIVCYKYINVTILKPGVRKVCNWLRIMFLATKRQRRTQCVSGGRGRAVWL